MMRDCDANVTARENGEVIVRGCKNRANYVMIRPTDGDISFCCACHKRQSERIGWRLDKGRTQALRTE